MYCRNCDTNAASGHFCRTCGSPLEQDRAVDVEATVVRVDRQETYQADDIPENGYTIWRAGDTGALPFVKTGPPAQQQGLPDYPQSTGHGSAVGYGDGGYPPVTQGQGYPGQDGGASAQPHLATAGLGRRFGAFVVDGLIAGVLTAAGYGAVAGALVWWLDSGSWAGPAAVMIVVPSLLAAVLLYNAIFKVGASGQSWGRSAFRVRVLDRFTGQPIGTGLSVIRAIVSGLPLVPFTCFFDSAGERRTLADRAATSRVVSAS